MNNKSFNIDFGAVIQILGYDQAEEIKATWQALAAKCGGVRGGIRYHPQTMGSNGYVPAVSFHLANTKANDMLWYELGSDGPVLATGE
jgi:hypothetical protein